MPPPVTLQGLNEIRLPYNSDNTEADTLLSASTAAFPELDLWTTIAFENNDVDDGRDKGKLPNTDDALDDEEEGPAIHDGHSNVLTGNAQSFDLHEFLAGFGIDPLLVPQLPQSAPLQPQASLAQLLTLQAASSGAPAPSQPEPMYAPPSYDRSPPDESLYAPSAKRARPRKTSLLSTADDQPDPSSPDTTTALSAAEDKRRRNTAASARFRLKKKEREAALERRAKQLEMRVGELERECEGLRRENGWLKGLVVGVTGASAGAQVKANKRTKDEMIEANS